MDTTIKLIKKFVWRDDAPPIHYRPGTSDESIIQAVMVDKKEYAFPKIPVTKCFDVGANIGVVSVIMALIYPDAKIYAFEPVKENFDILKMNTEHLKNVEAFNYGLGGDSGTRRIWDSDDKDNLGGYSVAIKNEGGSNRLIEIKDVASAVNTFGVPDVMKIDVEGAEAEILESMPNLWKVKWITGELHGIRDFQVLDLLSRHMDIACARPFGAKCWHFHAVNKELAESRGTGL